MSQTLAQIKAECTVPSRDCDVKVQKYCELNPNDMDFCGCSTNALKNVSDPALSGSAVKCWAKSCSQNANAYQFEFAKDLICPAVCIDNSTITTLGSNIISSSLVQASCGAIGNGISSGVLTEIYTYGISVTVLYGLLLFSLFAAIVFGV